MRRLVIWVWYNRNASVREDIFVSLDKMVTTESRIIIVINGEIDTSSWMRLQQYKLEIIQRDNLGYDAGAYKEILTTYLSRDSVQEYDELLLLNDSFFGPFDSYQTIFDKFQDVQCDFWGLTKWYGGTSEFFDGVEIPPHIQSYFLAFRKQVLEDKRFYQFWENLREVQSFKDAVIYFEVALSKYLTDLGYQFKVWTDLYPQYGMDQPGTVVYLSHAKDLVTKADFPVLKRKAVSMIYFEQIADLLQYIEFRYHYDVKLIMDDIYRNQIGTEPFCMRDMKKFILSHENIYIYGHGAYGRSVAAFCEFLEKPHRMFVVSEGDDLSEDEITFDNLKMGKKDGLIVALGEKNYFEVYPKLKDTVQADQLFVPCYEERQ